MGALSDLFGPERVAVVGATDREGSVGRAILTNLQEDYTGDVVPINPNRDAVLGLDCYESVAKAPPTDLAVIVVPSEKIGRAHV